MKDPLGYAGRRVAVVGAASGIGAATAGLLVDLGARVSVLDVLPLSDAFDRSIQLDLRDVAAIERAADALGALNALFSCAGVPGLPFLAPAAMPPVDVMTVNFVGPRHLAERVIPQMPQDSGIAFVASASGLGWQANLETLLPLATTADFATARAWCESHPDVIGTDTYFRSKEAINVWTAWRAASLIRDHGIRLNCTNPGSVETPMMDVFRTLMPDPPCGPIARMSTPDEQAWALVLMNSPRMSYLNGQGLTVDGGMFGAAMTGQAID